MSSHHNISEKIHEEDRMANRAAPGVSVQLGLLSLK